MKILLLQAIWGYLVWLNIYYIHYMAISRSWAWLGLAWLGFAWLGLVWLELCFVSNVSNLFLSVKHPQNKIACQRIDPNQIENQLLVTNLWIFRSLPLLLGSNST